MYVLVLIYLKIDALISSIFFIGVGKTQMIQQLAQEYAINFLPVSPADVFGKYVGESENNLRRIFETAYENQPSIIFLDEAEVLISRRFYNNIL